MRTGGFVTNSAIRRAGTEVKYSDTSGSAISGVNTAATGLLLNGIAQGTGVDQHVGRKVGMKSLLFRFVVNADAATYAKYGTIASATTGGALHWRVIIVYDKQANGAACQQSDILKASTGSLTGIPGMLQGMNLDNRDRFKIILEKNGTWSPYQASGPMREKFIKLKDREIIFQGTGANIADIATGSMYLFFIQDTTAAAGVNLQLSYFARLRYMDN